MFSDAVQTDIDSGQSTIEDTVEIRDSRDTTDDEGPDAEEIKALADQSTEAPVHLRKLNKTVIPVVIRALLDQWYSSFGKHKPPPCAITDQQRKSVYSRSAKFQHTTGEPLEVQIYKLPEFLDTDHKEKSIIVVQGEAQGPFIIALVSQIRTNQHLSYHIWEGVDGGLNGWEDKPSVTKTISPRPASTPGHFDDGGLNNRRSQRELPLNAALPLQSARDFEESSQGREKSPHQKLPAMLHSLLDEWYKVKGRVAPPCCVPRYLITTLRGHDGSALFRFRHRTGEMMLTSFSTLTEFRKTYRDSIYLIVVKGPTLGPFIVAHRSDGAYQKRQYHIWEGLEAQHEDGWEAEPSFTKVRTVNTGSGDEIEEPVDPTAVEDESGLVDTHTIQVGTVGSVLLGAFETIPTSVRTKLDEWSSTHGADAPPPCAIRSTNGPNVFLGKTGKPFRYLHVDGEELTAKVYRLAQKGSCKRDAIVVCRSTNHGPFVIGYHGGSYPTRYQIWEGISAWKADGFEEMPSIRKYTVSEPELENTTKDIQQVTSNRAISISDDDSRESMSEQQRISPRVRWISTTPYKSPLFPLAAAPRQVRTTLNQWFANHGSSETPPCAIRVGHLNPALENKQGGYNTYLHRSGEELSITAYAMEQTSPSWNPKAVLVAHSSRSGAFIIAHKSGSSPMRYQIWEGVDAVRSDGFEATPSILRYSSPLPDIERIYSDTQGLGDHNAAPSPDDTLANKDSIVTMPGNVEDEQIGKALAPARLDSLSTHRGLQSQAPSHSPHLAPGQEPRSMGPWTSYEEERAISHTFDVRAEGNLTGDDRFIEVSKRLYAEGIRRDFLSVRNYWKRRGCVKSGYDDPSPKDAMPSIASTSDSLTKYLVPKPEVSPTVLEEEESHTSTGPDCLASRPSDQMIPYPAPKRMLEASKHDARRSKGLWRLFEEDRVIDLMLDVRNEKALVGDSRFEEVSARLKAEGVKRGSLAVKNFWNRRGRARSGYDERRAPDGSIMTSKQEKWHKQKRAERSDNEEEGPLGGGAGRIRSKRQRLLHSSGDIPSTRATVPYSTDISEHAQNNVVCLFYSNRSPAPRVRLLSACDSVEKLFAQATAGDLFEDGAKRPSKAKVLVARFGNTTGTAQTKMAIVENDEEDFEALIKAIVEETGWWTVSKGAVGSSGTVEIRAAS